MELRTRPLAERFGLEVLDVDLASLDDATFQSIYRLWQRDPLLLFRRQSLTERELKSYSAGFGELEHIVRDDMHAPEHPEIIYITGLKRADGAYCRDFTQTITVDGEFEEAHGTACRQSDGTWRIVNA